MQPSKNVLGQSVRKNVSGSGVKSVRLLRCHLIHWICDLALILDPFYWICTVHLHFDWFTSVKSRTDLKPITRGRPLCCIFRVKANQECQDWLLYVQSQLKKSTVSSHAAMRQKTLAARTCRRYRFSAWRNRTCSQTRHHTRSHTKHPEAAQADFGGLLCLGCWYQPAAPGQASGTANR